MTLSERRKFIRELSANIVKEAIAKAEHMPSNWDGHELRRYLAQKFDMSAQMSLARSDRRRSREYRNTVITLNL